MRLQQVAGEEGLGGPHAAEEAVGAQQRRGQRPAAAGAAGTGSPRHSHAGQGPGRQRRVAAGPPRVPVVSPPPSPVTSRRRHQPQGAPPRRRSSSPFAAGRGRAHEPAADWVEPPPPRKAGQWGEGGVAGRRGGRKARVRSAGRGGAAGGAPWERSGGGRHWPRNCPVSSHPSSRRFSWEGSLRRDSTSCAGPALPGPGSCSCCERGSEGNRSRQGAD